MSEEDPGAPDGRAARAERRRAQRREAILLAAKAVFRDKGYHQASVHDIIDEARIARGTFYLYFSGKQDLFGELVADFLEIVRTQVRRIELGPDAPPPRIQLRDNFRRIVTAVLEHAAIASIILRDSRGYDDESRARVDSFFGQTLQLMRQAIQVGQGLQLVGPCDVNVVSVVALGGLRHSLVRMLEAQAAGPADPDGPSFTNPEAVADELLEFFLRGVSVES
ncbi:MAG: TetR/AcrR family transcriptional regulator [Nannocystaceae bacterium]|nr:TetR/AcrR family transcriptional regulator [bacterium]